MLQFLRIRSPFLIVDKFCYVIIDVINKDKIRILINKIQVRIKLPVITSNFKLVTYLKVHSLRSGSLVHELVGLELKVTTI